MHYLLTVLNTTSSSADSLGNGCVSRKTYVCARRYISSEVNLSRILDKHTLTYYGTLPCRWRQSDGDPMRMLASTHL